MYAYTPRLKKQKADSPRCTSNNEKNESTGEDSSSSDVEQTILPARKSRLSLKKKSHTHSITNSNRNSGIIIERKAQKNKVNPVNDADINKANESIIDLTSDDGCGNTNYSFSIGASARKRRIRHLVKKENNSSPENDANINKENESMDDSSGKEDTSPRVKYFTSLKKKSIALRTATNSKKRNVFDLVASQNVSSSDTGIYDSPSFGESPVPKTATSTVQKRKHKHVAISDLKELRFSPVLRSPFNKGVKNQTNSSSPENINLYEAFSNEGTSRKALKVKFNREEEETWIDASVHALNGDDIEDCEDERRGTYNLEHSVIGVDTLRALEFNDSKNIKTKKERKVTYATPAKVPLRNESAKIFAKTPGRFMLGKTPLESPKWETPSSTSSTNLQGPMPSLWKPHVSNVTKKQLFTSKKPLSPTTIQHIHVPKLSKLPTKAKTHSEKSSAIAVASSSRIAKQAAFKTGSNNHVKNKEDKQVIGYTKFGFKIRPNKEELKTAVNKIRVPKENIEQRRNVLSGVRSNRRFELLMKFRNK